MQEGSASACRTEMEMVAGGLCVGLGLGVGGGKVAETTCPAYRRPGLGELNSLHRLLALTATILQEFSD